jgi:DnaK suppressor protein
VEEARARELLAAERTRIEQALADLGRAADDELSHLDQHPADEGSELFADGTYGVSIESGRPIPDERLEAIPTAERTVEEQIRHDRGGGS